MPTLRHIAKESGAYVVGVTPFLRGSDVRDAAPGLEEIYGGDDDLLSQGNTTIVAPGGDVVAGPLVGEEGILYARIDPALVAAHRRRFDAFGHYARSDVFELRVDRSPKPPVSF